MPNNEKYDIDKMIRDCEKKKLPNEVIAFAVGSGRVAPKLGIINKQKAAMNFISELDGFLGFHPIDLWHTLLVFDTLNNAKSGKNLCKSVGILTGNYVVPILIDKQFAKGGEKDKR